MIATWTTQTMTKNLDAEDGLSGSLTPAVQLAAENLVATTKLAAAMAMLRRLEWADHDNTYSRCPICASNQDTGRHEPGCDLATLLRDLP